MDNADYEHPRLAAVYDVLDPDRSDLDPYVGMADEFGARSVLDVGCGTGVLAILLAGRGLDVTGIDPALASLDVARGKPGAEHVRWMHTDATGLPPMQVDLATMTANVAQAIVDPALWAATLTGIKEALRPGGHLVFETRDPARRAWEQWTAENTRTCIGGVESWMEITDVEGPLVRMRGTFVFADDGASLTSEGTLRFRNAENIDHDLRAAGFVVDEIRDAPDRPGREFVFVAHRV